MKTIEEKARAYDEAYKVAVELHNLCKEGTQTAFHRANLETMFPELAESEDEKIRKRLITDFGTIGKKEWGGLEVKDILAWLERQGEHAYFLSKIQVGDKVTRNEDGVLVNLSQLNRVAKPEENKGNIGEISPNSEWSEEDEHRIKDTVYFLETAKEHYASTEELDACIDWLKFIKDKVQPKQEWSEENKDYYDAIIAKLEVTQEDAALTDNQMNFLKSLRPQNRWKPSELQLGCLSDAIEHYNSLGYPAPKLKELLDDLKKLKEGKV